MHTAPMTVFVRRVLLRKLPPTLLVALALEVVSCVVFALYSMLISPGWSNSMGLAHTGLAIATGVLGVAGVLELARGTTGRTSAGLRVAAVGFALGIAYALWPLVLVFDWHLSAYYEPVLYWGGFAVNAVPVIGVAIAVFDRNRRAAILGLIVLLVAEPLPPIAETIYSWIRDSPKAQVGLETGQRLVVVFLLFMLVRLVAAGEPARVPHTASAGLRMVATALWLRVIAAVSYAGLKLIFMVMQMPGEALFGIVKLAKVSSVAVGAISVAMIARGALSASRAGIAELRRMPLVLAAGGAAWCLGVTLEQLPYVYRTVYGGHEELFSGMFVYRAPDYTAEEYTTALSVVMPLIATGAMVVIATAIARFAARRGLEGLRREAVSKGMGYAALALTSIGIQQWLVPGAHSLDSAAYLMLAAGCALAGAAMMARLCALAADSLTGEPGLPQAKVI
jgi:hypothetical protein